MCSVVWCCVSACVSRLGGARRRRGAALRSLSSPAPWGAAPGRPKVDGQRLGQADGRAVASCARGRERAPEVYQKGPLRHLANSIFNGRRAPGNRGGRSTDKKSQSSGRKIANCPPTSPLNSKYARPPARHCRRRFPRPREPRGSRARQRPKNNAHRLLALCLVDSGSESAPVHAPGLAGTGRGSSFAPLPKNGLPAPHLQQ